MEKLRVDYLPNITTDDAIRSGNIALLSDLALSDAVLKSTALQANLNSRDTNEQNHRNTFLFRSLDFAKIFQIHFNENIMFFHRFSVSADLNLFKIRSKKVYDGATHIDDICYIFQ